MQYFTLLTAKGAEKIAAATAANTTVDLTHIALGDGNGSVVMPDASKTALVNEVYRASLNDLRVDANNANWVVAESNVPANEGNFWVREVGVFDVAGDLIAIGNYPETFKPVAADGVAKDLYMKVIFEVSSSDAVNLQVDPSVVMASQEYVNDGLDKKSDNNHNHKWDEILEKPTIFPPSSHDHTDENLSSFNGDLNDFDKTGMFYAISASNTPTGSDGEFISMIYSIHTATQIFHVHNNDTYFRRKVGGVWGAWKRQVTDIEFLMNTSTNGYQKLPSGLIIQWGRFTSTTIADQEVSFPITFPTKVLGVMSAGAYTTALAEHLADFSCMIFSNSKFKVNRRDSIGENYTYGFIAIGH